MLFELFLEPKAEGCDVVLWDAIAVGHFALISQTQVFLDLLIIRLNRYESLSFVCAHLLEYDLINVDSQHEHIKVRVLERLHKGRFKCSIEGLVDHKVDLFLALFHILDVLIQADKCFRPVIFRLHSKQLHQRLLILIVNRNSFLEEVAKFCIPLSVGFWVASGLVVEHFDDAAGEHVSQLCDQTGILVVLS